MKIIALKGDSETGKSDTINIVYQLMILDNYMQVEGQFIVFDSKGKVAAKNDFRDILIKGFKRVGIVSIGDYYLDGSEQKGDVEIDLAISVHLKHFKDNDCFMAICACRSGRDYEKEITNDYTDYVFVEKEKISKAILQRPFNTFIAESIFKMI